MKAAPVLAAQAGIPAALGLRLGADDAGRIVR